MQQDNQPIYLVTTLLKDGTGSRCVGWFRNLEEATEIVMGNYGDICERLYRWAVIEPQASGLYGCDRDPYEPSDNKWFEFVQTRPRQEGEPSGDGTEVRPVKMPERFAGVCGFGIG